MKNSLDPTNFGVTHLQRMTIGFPLLLICLAVFLFEIETDLQLPKVIFIILIGFFIHSFLPFRFRVPFFLLLNFITLILLVDWWLAIFILGLGTLIVAISTFSKVSLNSRIALISLIGLLLIAMRVGWLEVSGSQVVSRIVGILFMFRVLVYLYELRYEKEPVSFLTRLSYFFLLPNLFFPIFPVVDYTTFKRNYFSKPAADIYKKGILWMAKGVFHLLLYRIIYYYLLPSPTEIQILSELLFYMVMAYLLTLRLSGLFHFSAGVLCLFGYDLPKTFDRHFLASGFSDLWRRINVYWREFLMKVFYYPLYFKLKKYGMTTAMIITLIIVFVINMLLHSYQWFWIRGDFIVTTTDLIFWGIFGVFVIVDALLQQKNRAKRKQQKSKWQNAFIKSTKVVAMFFLMSIMWSLWISPDLNTWLGMVSIIDGATFLDWIKVLLLILSLISGGIFLQYLIDRYPTLESMPWSYNLKWVSMGILAIVLFGVPSINGAFNNTLSIDTKAILSSKLNQFDEEQLLTGYYDNLLTSSNINSKVWELELEKPDDWQLLNTTGIIVTHKKQRYRALKPNQSINHKGALIVTNSHGMRDKEYSKIKTKNVYRVALIGTSIDMGMGVENNEVYENLVEQSALGSFPVQSKYNQLEILNFSVSGTTLPSYQNLIQHKVIHFNPDMIWVAEQQLGIKKTINLLSRRIIEGKFIQNDVYIDSLIQQIPETSLKSEAKVKAFLEQRQFELIEHYYKAIKSICDAHQIQPVMLYFQSLNKSVNTKDRDKTFAIVKKLGYEIIDLSTVFEHIDNRKSLQLGKWDTQHPNKKGHQIIANSIMKQLININFEK